MSAYLPDFTPLDELGMSGGMQFKERAYRYLL